MRYRIWIDRGGTFTDGICQDTLTGTLKVAKVLSSDTSVIDSIRELLELDPTQSIPPCDVRMGTTIATNALLERKGRPCLLIISRGFGDALAIGTQARPNLFALDIRMPAPLYSSVIEVAVRGTPTGEVLESYDPGQLMLQLEQARCAGIQSVAIVLLHAHKNGKAERALRDLVSAAGLKYVALSHEVVEEQGLLARGDTTVVDAYLTPLLRDYLESVCAALPNSSVRLMQSSGGLTSAPRLRGPQAILSGPAGGVVAFSKIAQAAGYQQVIGFDMGGTSTDVSRHAGAFEWKYENVVAGVRLRAPMLAIHTVAAGGGSLCRYDGQQFLVGPESAGANPGPLCYGSSQATTPTVTDINLVLGRLQVDRFPFPLDAKRARTGIQAIVDQLGGEGHELGLPSVAEGFFQIANLNMAEAIRQVSVARGFDVRDHALFVFGGAGGQHACAIAAALGMRAVLFHRLSGVLSAYGMGLADVTIHREADAGARSLSDGALRALLPVYARMEAEAIQTLASEGYAREDLEHLRLLDLRYRGTETALTLPLSNSEQLLAAFAAEHQREFGYRRPDHPIEIVVARVQVVAKAAASVPEVPEESVSACTAPLPIRFAELWCEGSLHEQVPVFLREHLVTGQTLAGPALILESTGTIVLDPGFTLRVRGDLLIALPSEARQPLHLLPQRRVGKSSAHSRTHDPVLLEVMSHLFMSIAEQMGHVLQRTAISTNIRERLDFSCAVFDAQANLIANAPHIPVHLGAMGESVKAVVQAFTEMRPGDVFVTNDPSNGGSHLPDVTVVTPVHVLDRAPAFFVASRGHHADIGGITPGSMPANSTRLEEEGVLLPAMRIVHRNVFDSAGLQQRLSAGPYPARAPARNISDIEAQIAANQLGAQRLGALSEQYGLSTVNDYMQHVQDNAAYKVRQAIAELPDGDHHFEDELDSGARIHVTLGIRGSDMSVDFTGTGPELASNLNAPRAVTIAAVIYFLRTLVQADIPLNAGCLAPVTLTIVEGSLLSPSQGCAVVGGNVETSQRIVDVLLGAVGKAAASQGTMNNLSFGDPHFGYYETIAGGAGAGPGFAGASAVQTHMTNTRITDAEVLESQYPVQLIEFSRRRGSGGRGKYVGGDGVVRELLFLAPVEVSLLTQRRSREPFGLAGGGPGKAGRNLLDGQALPGTVQLSVPMGARLRIETPGGGGFGTPEEFK